MQAAYAVALMFCSGPILQAFLLKGGFTARQVQLYYGMTQIVQVAMMLICMFFFDAIRHTKNVMGSCILTMLFTVIAIFVVLGRMGSGNPPVAFFFVMVFIAYCGVGLQTLGGYKMPYEIFDIRDYGRVCGVSGAVAQIVCLSCSALYSIALVKFAYESVHLGFFIVGGICVLLASFSAFSFKERLPAIEGVLAEREKQSNTQGLIKVLKNKTTYLLLFPNFIRGFTTGIVALLATIGIDQAIINENAGGYMSMAMQIALVLGNLVFAFACKKKVSVKKIMMISAVVAGVFLPLSIARTNAVDFIAGYFIVQFFMIFVDTAIPVLVTEIVPYEQMGAFTSIRLSVFMFGSFLISLLLDWAKNAIGYVALFIIAAVLINICCLSYYLVANHVKKQASKS